MTRAPAQSRSCQSRLQLAGERPSAALALAAVTRAFRSLARPPARHLRRALAPTLWHSAHRSVYWTSWPLRAAQLEAQAQQLQRCSASRAAEPPKLLASPQQQRQGAATYRQARAVSPCCCVCPSGCGARCSTMAARCRRQCRCRPHCCTCSSSTALSTAVNVALQHESASKRWRRRSQCLQAEEPAGGRCMRIHAQSV